MVGSITTKKVKVRKANGTTYFRTDYYRDGKRVAKPPSVKAAETRAATKLATKPKAKVAKAKVAKAKVAKAKVAKAKVAKAKAPKPAKAKANRPAKPQTSPKKADWYVLISTSGGQEIWQKMPDSEMVERAYEMYKAKTPIPCEVDFEYMVDPYGNYVRRGTKEVALRLPKRGSPFSIPVVRPLKSTKVKWYRTDYVQGVDEYSTPWEMLSASESANIEAKYQAYLKDPAAIHSGFVFKGMAYSGGQGLKRVSGKQTIEGPTASYKRIVDRARANIGRHVTWWVGSPDGWRRSEGNKTIIEADYLAYLEGGYPRGGTYGEHAVDFQRMKRSDGWEIRRQDPYFTLPTSVV